MVNLSLLVCEQFMNAGREGRRMPLERGVVRKYDKGIKGIRILHFFRMDPAGQREEHDEPGCYEMILEEVKRGTGR